MGPRWAFDRGNCSNLGVQGVNFEFTHEARVSWKDGGHIPHFSEKQATPRCLGPVDYGTSEELEHDYCGWHVGNSGEPCAWTLLSGTINVLLRNLALVNY